MRVTLSVTGAWYGQTDWGMSEFGGKNEYLRFLREAEEGWRMTTNEELLERLKPQPGDDERTLAIKARLRKDIIENPDVDDDGLLVEWTPEQYARARGTAYISARVPRRKRDEE